MSDDESVLLAAALVVRGVRQGSVCVDIAAAPGTTAVDGVPAEDVAALPWPAACGVDCRAGDVGDRRSRLRRAGGPAAAAGRRAAVPGPVLAPGAADRRVRRRGAAPGRTRA
ncbi:MAG: hypothetical protein WKF83_10925 [Nocardioidaceae bacterium]